MTDNEEPKSDDEKTIFGQFPNWFEIGKNWFKRSFFKSFKAEERSTLDETEEGKNAPVYKDLDGQTNYYGGLKLINLMRTLNDTLRIIEEKWNNISKITKTGEGKETSVDKEIRKFTVDTGVYDALWRVLPERRFYRYSSSKEIVYLKKNEESTYTPKLKSDEFKKMKAKLEKDRNTPMKKLFDKYFDKYRIKVYGKVFEFPIPPEIQAPMPTDQTHYIRAWGFDNTSPLRDLYIERLDEVNAHVRRRLEKDEDATKRKLEKIKKELESGKDLESLKKEVKWGPYGDPVNEWEDKDISSNEINSRLEKWDTEGVSKTLSAIKTAGENMMHMIWGGEEDKGGDFINTVYKHEKKIRSWVENLHDNVWKQYVKQIRKELFTSWDQKDMNSRLECMRTWMVIKTTGVWITKGDGKKEWKNMVNKKDVYPKGYEIPIDYLEKEDRGSFDNEKQAFEYYKKGNRIYWKKGEHVTLSEELKRRYSKIIKRIPEKVERVEWKWQGTDINGMPLEVDFWDNPIIKRGLVLSDHYKNKILKNLIKKEEEKKKNSKKYEKTPLENAVKEFRKRGYGITDKEAEEGEIEVRRFNSREDYEFCVDSLELIQLMTYIDNEFDTIRDTLRDARYHKDSLTIYDWVSKDENVTPHRKELLEKGIGITQKDVDRIKGYEIELANGRYVVGKREPSNLNPGFDIRALKYNYAEEWKCPGKVYYYHTPEQVDHDVFSPDRKPAVTTRGLAMFIIHTVLKRTRSIKDAKKVFDAIDSESRGYDYGPRIIGTDFTHDIFDLSANIKSVNERLAKRQAETESKME